MMRSLSVVFLLACLPLVLFARSLPDDAKELKSKDPEVRLAVVLRVAEAGGEGAGKLLGRALGDKDWQVAAEAARGLGRWGTPADTKALVKLAWDGPVRVVREAAARAAAQLDAAEALKGLAKKMSGERSLRVAEAYAWVLEEAPDELVVSAPKALVKLLKAKDTLTRAAGARALILATREGRAERLTGLFESEHVAVIAAGLEAATRDPRPEQVDVLVELLERPLLVDVLARRALAALVASAGATASEATGQLHAWAFRLAASPDASVAARGPRLCELAAAAGFIDPSKVTVSLRPALASKVDAVRAAAARALRLAPQDEVFGRLHELGSADPSARARRAALASSLSQVDAHFDEQRAWLIERLEIEPVPEVREDVAVALGLEDLDGVGEALVRALDDDDWGVAVCAAVSLGRTRQHSAVAPLAALTDRTDDWRLRGAGVVGLCHVMRKEVVAPLIEALDDPEPLVARTALGFLKSINRSAPTSAEIGVWRAWWLENKRRVQLITAKQRIEQREKYGYAVSPAELYAGLDVMVFQSGADHIETVLDQLGISYRSTSSNRVAASALDAAGVFVSNCTGTMQAADVERLQWFTKAGGYLFGSCWALHDTIERVAPGAVQRLATSSEVLDQVTASACDPSSPYLKGVFSPGVVPIYHLVGAFLIDVLEPERVEVLVDSAECAERWGGGNLAAWYRVGHGRILDSANHFAAQGLAEVTGLKTPEDRMAYAVDHMGTSLAKIRATRGEKWWSSSMKAAKQISDLSVFTLVTNFVRARRIEGY